MLETGSIPGSGRSPGEGNGNPLQYSCLESPQRSLVGYRPWAGRVRQDWTTLLTSVIYSHNIWHLFNLIFTTLAINFYCISAWWAEIHMKARWAKPCWWLFLQDLNNPYAFNKYLWTKWFKEFKNIIEWNGTTWASDQYFFSQNYDLWNTTSKVIGDFYPLQLLCVCAKLLQICLNLCNPMNYGQPGSSVHGTLQSRILEWLAMPSSKGSSWLGD